MKEVHITPVLNGFIVKVGCKTLVFESVERLTKELARYLKDREATAKEYLGKKKA